MPEQPIRVLLIDDDDEDFLMFRDFLSEIRGQKYEIERAASYDDGKQRLAQHQHDVCFVDYRLGKKTGLDLIREAIAEGYKTPLILLTGYGEREVDLEAMQAGAADYLVKDQISSTLLERSMRYSIYRAHSVQTLLDREAQILTQDRLASIGLLASSLAHEIGTPLGVIRGRAEYMETLVKGSPEIKKNVDIVISQIDRISKLIHSLLNLARGGHAKRTEQIDLAQIVSEVVDLMGHEFRRHSIEIKNEMTEGAKTLIRADSGSLHQVLLNLFVNSIHAIESAVKDGRESGHYIRVNTQSRDSQWLLTVEDTGCGISKKNLKNIFKPFFTTKDIGSGTGLGLATSYRIVESFGGGIQVKSSEGQGTEFQISLPKS